MPTNPPQEEAAPSLAPDILLEHTCSATQTGPVRRLAGLAEVVSPSSTDSSCDSGVCLAQEKPRQVRSGPPSLPHCLPDLT